MKESNTDDVISIGIAPFTSKKFQLLLKQLYEIQDIRKAVRVLTWDREVNMPVGGEQDRINQITTLKRLGHTLYTSDYFGELIEGAAEELNGAPYNCFETSLIRFLKRDYHQAKLLSGEFIARSASINGKATTAWKKARQEDDFSVFEPWLIQVVEIAQEKAEVLGNGGEPYDALLNQFEPGTKTSELSTLFEEAKQELINLYRSIRQDGTSIDDRFLYQHFEVNKQKRFSRYIAEAIGYDFSRGHLATAVHPFSTSLSRNDVRITTRYNPEFLSTSIFATLHETGHALYIQNVHPSLTRTPLAIESSAGLDESQSRLFENMVGRSFGFWTAHFPRLQKLFPTQLAEINPKQFFEAVNKVQPSLIRVEADELTYNMHIILRFELEQALINQSLSVKDLPEAWNEKMRRFLGVVPPSDRFGCLQDIHWTLVGFGYFPTYALGNLYAAQLFEAACKNNPEIKRELRDGKATQLLDWMRLNIHQHGRKFTAAEIIKEVTGKPLDHKAFVRYAVAKFSEIYDL